VGSPGLTTGIANTVKEAEQINRLCWITHPPQRLAGVPAPPAVASSASNGAGAHLSSLRLSAAYGNC